MNHLIASFLTGLFASLIGGMLMNIVVALWLKNYSWLPALCGVFAFSCGGLFWVVTS